MRPAACGRWPPPAMRWRRSSSPGSTRDADEGGGSSAVRIGVISDTHGLLRPAALSFLAGCAHIVHGGDIGDDERLLQSLRAIAPLTVVRGNNDNQPWQRELP